MKKIAIIEDDLAISQMYRMKFEADGFEVQVAENGEDGVALVTRMHPDMILCDLQMPIMDGHDAIAAIRKTDEHKTTPIFVLTNLGEEEAPKNLASFGIDGYIVKADLTPRQVVERVKEALSL